MFTLKFIGISLVIISAEKCFNVICNREFRFSNASLFIDANSLVLSRL